MEFSSPEHWSGWPFPSPGDLPNPGIEPRSPTLQGILYQLSHQGSSIPELWPVLPRQPLPGQHLEALRVLTWRITCSGQKVALCDPSPTPLIPQPTCLPLKVGGATAAEWGSRGLCRALGPARSPHPVSYQSVSPGPSLLFFKIILKRAASSPISGLSFALSSVCISWFQSI